MFEDKWFSEITDFSPDYYKGYDKDKNCFLISKKSGQIITGVKIKYSDIFFDSGNYFLDSNDLICPARIYNKAIKPLKMISGQMIILISRMIFTLLLME